MLNLYCGVTTCPRPGANYLSDTLRSLESAGFDVPLIGADDAAKAPSGYPVIRQTQRVGAYGNFKAVLTHLCDARPDADGYLIVQDDVLLSGGLSGYLTWPEAPEDIGVVSPYCAAANHRDGDGWHKLDNPSGHNTFGALCVLMPRASAQNFLCSGIGGESRHMTDFWLGEFCKAKKLSYWTHSPSLAKHTGKVSAINARRKVKTGQEQYRDCAVFLARCPE